MDPHIKAVGLTSRDLIIQGHVSYLRGLESFSEQTKTRKHLKEFKEGRGSGFSLRNISLVAM